MWILAHCALQVQYSLLDRRPLETGLVDLCTQRQIDILAYGVLAGGFLTDTWLGKRKPKSEVHVPLTVSGVQGFHPVGGGASPPN